MRRMFFIGLMVPLFIGCDQKKEVVVNDCNEIEALFDLMKERTILKGEDMDLWSLKSERHQFIKNQINEIYKEFLEMWDEIIEKNDFENNIEEIEGLLKFVEQRFDLDNESSNNPTTLMLLEICYMEVDNLRNIDLYPSCMESVNVQLIQVLDQILSTLTFIANESIFKFNKVEPVAFSNSSYIKEGDFLNLNIGILTYDTTSPVKIEYWIDDSLRLNENKFKWTSRAGDYLKVKEGKGVHTIYGNIEVIENNNPIMRNWKYTFEVE